MKEWDDQKVKNCQTADNQEMKTIEETNTTLTPVSMLPTRGRPRKNQLTTAQTLTSNPPPITPSPKPTSTTIKLTYSAANDKNGTTNAQTASTQSSENGSVKRRGRPPFRSIKRASIGTDNTSEKKRSRANSLSDELTMNSQSNSSGSNNEQENTVESESNHKKSVEVGTGSDKLPVDGRTPTASSSAAGDAARQGPSAFLRLHNARMRMLKRSTDGTDDASTFNGSLSPSKLFNAISPSKLPRARERSPEIVTNKSSKENNIISNHTKQSETSEATTLLNAVRSEERVAANFANLAKLRSAQLPSTLKSDGRSSAVRSSLDSDESFISCQGVQSTPKEMSRLSHLESPSESMNSTGDESSQVKQQTSGIVSQRRAGPRSKTRLDISSSEVTSSGNNPRSSSAPSTLVQTRGIESEEPSLSTAVSTQTDTMAILVDNDLLQSATFAFMQTIISGANVTNISTGTESLSSMITRLVGLLQTESSSNGLRIQK